MPNDLMSFTAHTYRESAFVENVLTGVVRGHYNCSQIVNQFIPTRILGHRQAFSLNNYSYN